MKMVKIINRRPVANACGRGERITWLAENGIEYISFYTEQELKTIDL